LHGNNGFGGNCSDDAFERRRYKVGLVQVRFDPGFHPEANRAKAEAQPGDRFDAEDTIWFVALAKEQLTLIANDRFHGIPFVVGEIVGHQ
jgi:hypothetical protein